MKKEIFKIQELEIVPDEIYSSLNGGHNIKREYYDVIEYGEPIHDELIKTQLVMDVSDFPEEKIEALLSVLNHQPLNIWQDIRDFDGSSKYVPTWLNETFEQPAYESPAVSQGGTIEYSSVTFIKELDKAIRAGKIFVYRRKMIKS